MTDSIHNYLYKLCFLGKMSVGKSCLCTRFSGSQFPYEKKSTIGATFMTAKARIANGLVKLEIWDTAGQERFKALAPMYYRGSQGVFVVYDVTAPESFTEAKECIQTVRSKVENPLKVTVLLLGNKYDLVNESSDPSSFVPTEEVRKWCEENNVLFYEVSAKSGFNIAAVLKGLLTGTVQWETDGAPTFEQALGIEEETKESVSSTPTIQGIKEQKTIWRFEDVKQEDCKGGLLGQQADEGKQTRFEGMSYRTYASSPILELLDDESKVEIQMEKKSGCCGGK